MPTFDPDANPKDEAPLIDDKDREIETLRIQLAACGVAARQNTESTIKDRLTQDSPYWSGSYQDVCNAVDREMIWRRRKLEES